MNPFPENPNSVPEPPASPPLEQAPLWPVDSSPPAMPADPPWTGWDVLRIGLMALVALVLVLFGLALAVPGADFRARLNLLTNRLELQILGQMAAYLLVLGYMYVLVTRERRQPRFWHAVHWNWPERVWIFPMMGFFLQAVFLVVERFLPFPKETPFDAVLKRPFTIILISVFSVTLGPLMEELFFRGFFYPVVKRRAGVGAAIVATAFPFALIHAAQYGYSWASVLLIFVVGVVLAAVRENADSVLASFLVHVGYNGTIIFLLFAASDGFRHLEKLK